MKLYKNEKILLAVLSLLLVIAIAVTVYSGVILARQNYYMKNGVFTEYLISFVNTDDDGNESYVATYVANREYKEDIYKKADRKTYIGETLKMYYMESNPDDFIVIDGRNRENVAFPIGIISTVCLVGIMLLIFMPLRRRTQLLKKGEWKHCKVKEIEKLSFGRVRILCDSSAFAQRKKKPFYSFPFSKKLLPKKIKEQSLSVYYDGKNPNRYYVKIDDFTQED